MHTNDHIEMIIAEGLKKAGIKFYHESDKEYNKLFQDNKTGTEGTGKKEENRSRLDFYLPDHDIWIECKRFPSERITNQLDSQENIILIQGLQAAKVFADMISGFIGKESPNKIHRGR